MWQLHERLREHDQEFEWMPESRQRKDARIWFAIFVFIACVVIAALAK
jgi:hypothetical protein